MSDELGRLQDLPPEYLAALRRHDLVPLWPSLRALLPAQLPARRTRPKHWAYAAIRPLLLQAGALTPIDKAERRVLVLANPGHGTDSLQASAAMYLGMQLLLPGEWAPNHRHTPNAVRMVVEGQGAWTTVDGQRCPMQAGDLILTPSGLWHEHGHDGIDPVIWLDVLDLPLAAYLEISYHLPGGPQPRRDAPASAAFGAPGVLPAPVFSQPQQRYPMLRYVWSEVRSALVELANGQPDLECVQLRYANPQSGADALQTLGFYALMLRPSQQLVLPARSPAAVFHLIEGALRVACAETSFALAQSDTCCLPGYSRITLGNAASDRPAFVFIADETPLHRSLGVYEQRSDDQAAMAMQR